ncbi:MAG: hypothetical protein WKF37_20270 [Bryobacteraceae bacterium]
MIAVSVSNPSLKAAAFCDAIGRFYAGEVSAAFNSVGRTLPVGLSEIGTPADTAMLTAPLGKKNGEGRPLYPHGVRDVKDTADPVALIRNALTSHHDQNALVILAGPATGLAALLRLPGAPDLITSKVRMLVFAGGDYPSGTPDPHVTGDIASARQLFAEWPTPIVAVGRTVGEQVLFPASSMEKDFSWSPAHPVVDAFRASGNELRDVPALSPAAALFAVRPDQGYFQRSAPGTISIEDGGATRFAATAAGKHTYLTVDAAQRERIQKTFVELASAKPVPRLPRRRPMAQPQQPPEKKPELPVVPLK